MASVKTPDPLSCQLIGNAFERDVDEEAVGVGGGAVGVAGEVDGPEPGPIDDLR